MIPRKIVIPPKTFHRVNPSPRIKKARTVDPTGSARMVIATSEAGMYFKAQLKVVCPINCGMSARRKKRR